MAANRENVESGVVESDSGQACDPASAVDPADAAEQASRAAARAIADEDAALSAECAGGALELAGRELGSARDGGSKPGRDAGAADDETVRMAPLPPLAEVSSARDDSTVSAPDETAETSSAKAEALASLSDLTGAIAMAAPLRDELAADAAEATSRAAHDAETARGASAQAGREATAGTGEETVLLSRDGEGSAASLTRELPGQGSVPPVEKTVMFRRAGSVPMRLDQASKAERSARKHLSRPRKAIIALVVIALLAGGGYEGYRWWEARQAEEQKAEAAAATTLFDVPLSVKIEGLSTSSAGTYGAVGSKIPVQIDGQDASGSIVDAVQYVDEKGGGLRLLPGDYTLSIAASPIAADGTMYEVPSDKLTVKVRRDVKSYADAGTFSFKVPSADSITDKQIELAYKYASAGGAPSDEIAQVLERAATARRDAAVASATAQEKELQREADKRHKATNSYSFDLPAEWYGHVVTSQNGDTVNVYLASDRSKLVCKLTVERDGFDAGDANNGVLGSVSLGNGRNVVVSGQAYPWVIQQTATGKTGESVSTYSEDEAAELVKLQTGGDYTFEQIRRGVMGDGGEAAAMKMVQDHLAQVLLPSIKAN